MLKSILIAVLTLAAAGKLSAQVTSPDQPHPQEEVQGWVVREVSGAQNIVWLTPTGSDTILAIFGDVDDNIFNLRSTDRGERWESIEYPYKGYLGAASGTHIYSVFKVSQQEDGIAVSRDAGKTWVEKRPGANRITKIVSVSEDTAFAVEDQYVIRTTDGGDTWTRYEIYSHHGFDQFDGLHGVIVGALEDPDIPNHEWTALCNSTKDGWKTYTRHLTDVLVDLGAVEMLDKTTWIAIRGDRTLAKTTNGNKWRTIDIGFKDHLFRKMTFVDDHRGWLIADKGLILHSEDGGETWVRQFSPVVDRFYDIKFIDSSLGFISLGDGRLLVTSNGGKSWVGPADQVHPSDLRVYPNPASNELTIEVLLPSSTPPNIEIVDQSGRTVFSSTRPGVIGKNELRVDLSHLASGSYLAVVNQGGRQQQAPFTVQR